MLRFLVLTGLAALVLADLGPQPRHLEDSHERVVGGEVVRPNSWPWQVSLQYSDGAGFYHKCGGTLIEKGWVMTAAHCVEKSVTYRVVLGEHDLNEISDREQIIDVSEVHPHSEYNKENIHDGYDIALLRLATEATLNEYVQLGSLLSSNQLLPHNNLCYITGWGDICADDSVSNQLKQALLPLVDYSTCSKSDWWNGYINTEMVCAGGAAESACNGDSGGPLNCLFNGKYYVHGIASFVCKHQCNYPKKPTVFTRVSAYIDWMDSIMKM